MQKVILFIFSLVLCAQLSAQDVITKKDGTDIKAKITEVTPDAVKYYRESAPDGPLYTIMKSEIFRITYSDGTTEMYNASVPSTSTSVIPAPEQTSEGERAYASEAAQLIPGMKYRDLKDIYDRSDYASFDGDVWRNPGLMALCSFFVPGLGQMISGETGRGLAYLLSSFGLLTAGSVCMVASDYADWSAFVALGLSCASLGIDIAAIVDAGRVAKVHNMYRHDLKTQNIVSSMKLTPYVDIACAGTQHMQPVAGLSLRITL